MSPAPAAASSPAFSAPTSGMNGKGITGIRQDKDMTQAQLARESGLSLKYVSMIEGGTNPSLKTIFKCCNALGVTLEEVMEQEGIGTVPRKPKKLEAVQVDLPVDDPQIKKLLGFLKKLSVDDRRRALRLIKTSFDPR